MTPPAKDWIQMFPSGVDFYPLNPDPRSFNIQDQAHHLSMLCRYVGGVSKFYSVAEHAVHVSRVVYARVVKKGALPYSPEALHAARWGLIHDNSEAYLGDISKPVKHSEPLTEFREYEKRLQSMIATWLGLDPEEPEIVKDVDSEILGTEARQLKAPINPKWEPFLPKMIPGLVIHALPPQRAKEVYLLRFNQLFNVRF